MITCVTKPSLCRGFKQECMVQLKIRSLQKFMGIEQHCSFNGVCNNVSPKNKNALTLVFFILSYVLLCSLLDEMVMYLKMKKKKKLTNKKVINK